MPKAKLQEQSMDINICQLIYRLQAPCHLRIDGSAQIGDRLGEQEDVWPGQGRLQELLAGNRRDLGCGIASGSYVRVTLADVADLGLENCSKGFTWSEFATRSVGGICDLPMFSLVSGINAQMIMMWAPKTIA
jgi:hypothetical protein